MTNTTMALVAASAGDCTVPVCQPNPGTACANLPTATTTVDQDRVAFEACIAATASARLAAQAEAAKAIICARAGALPIGK